MVSLCKFSLPPLFLLYSLLSWQPGHAPSTVGLLLDKITTTLVSLVLVVVYYHQCFVWIQSVSFLCIILCLYVCVCLYLPLSENCYFTFEYWHKLYLLYEANSQVFFFICFSFEIFHLLKDVQIRKMSVLGEPCTRPWQWMVSVNVAYARV